jgi:hypothetical protein
MATCGALVGPDLVAYYPERYDDVSYDFDNHLPDALSCAVLVGRDMVIVKASRHTLERLSPSAVIRPSFSEVHSS